MVHEKEGIAWDVLQELTNDPARLSPRAEALLKCKGKRGCNFAECVERALGKVPISVQKACPTKYPTAPKRITPPRRKAMAY